MTSVPTLSSSFCHADVVTRSDGTLPDVILSTLPGLLVERKVNEKAIVSLSIGSERKIKKKSEAEIAHSRSPVSGKEDVGRGRASTFEFLFYHFLHEKLHVPATAAAIDGSPSFSLLFLPSQQIRSFEVENDVNVRRRLGLGRHPQKLECGLEGRR